MPSFGHALMAREILPPLVQALAPADSAGEDPAAILRRYDELRLRPVFAPGFHQVEDWGGIAVSWASREARLFFEPQGDWLIVQYMINHPDVTPENPVIVQMGVEGGPSIERTHEETGFASPRFDLTA